MNQKKIFDNIMSRTSVRSFLDQPVESEKVEMLLHAAMAAPSACNKQPWHFAVIDDRKLLISVHMPAWQRKLRLPLLSAAT